LVESLKLINNPAFLTLMLTIKDKTILEYLYQNCRISTKKISQLSGIPQQTVAYRIKKLESEKLIFRYDILPNFSLLPVQLWLHFIHCPNQHKEKTIEKLKAIPQTYTIFETIDYHNIILIEITAKNTDSVIAQLPLKCKTKKIKSLFKLNYSIFLPSNYSLPKQKTRAISLDKIDYELIDYLSFGGGRTPLVQIAKDLNSTFNIISYRFKRLEKNGYFFMPIVQPSNSLFSVQPDFIYFTTKNISTDNVLALCKQHPNIPYILALENGYLMQILSNSFEEFSKKTKQVLNILENYLVTFKVIKHEQSILLNRLNLSKILK